MYDNAELNMDQEKSPFDKNGRFRERLILEPDPHKKHFMLVTIQQVWRHPVTRELRWIDNHHFVCPTQIIYSTHFRQYAEAWTGKDWFKSE